jgi:paraquat-inducible protein B
VHLVYDANKGKVLAPVRYQIEPQRVAGTGTRTSEPVPDVVAALLERGLRASLASGNLITGGQHVALDFVPNAAPAQVAVKDGDFVLPTIAGGGFAGIQDSASALLDKVNQIPFDSIGQSLDGILKSTNDLVQGPQAKEALTKLAATLAEAQAFTRNLNSGTAPAFKHLPQMANHLQSTVTNANKLLVSLDTGYGSDTRFNRELERLLAQLNDAVTSIRSLADLLARHPEALVRGRQAGGVE